MAGHLVATLLAGLVVALVLAGCSSAEGGPLATTSPTGVPVPTSPSPTDPVSPGTASPSTASPGTASPGTASPGAGPSGAATASPGSSGVQVTCASVTVTALGRTSVGPLRTTDIATVVSDDRNLTPGTRQQTDFTTPVLTAPGGGTVTDAGTVQQVANLLAAQKQIGRAHV